MNIKFIASRPCKKIIFFFKQYPWAAKKPAKLPALSVKFYCKNWRRFLSKSALDVEHMSKHPPF